MTMLRTLRRRWAFRRAFDRNIGRWLAIAADVQDGRCHWPTVTFTCDLDPRIEIPPTLTANILAIFVAYGIKAGMDSVYLDHERGTYEVGRVEEGDERRELVAPSARIVVAVVCDLLNAMPRAHASNEPRESRMLRRLSDLVVEYPSARPGELRIRIGHIRVAKNETKRPMDYPFSGWWGKYNVAINIDDRQR